MRSVLKAKARGFEPDRLAQRLRGELDWIALRALILSTMFNGPFATGVVNENPPHGFGRRGEKMSSRVPARGGFAIDKAEVGFVHERGRLKRLPRFLMSEPRRGQFAEIVINQWQQAFASRGIAGIKLGQDLRDIGRD